jgi:hypothetical protein
MCETGKCPQVAKLLEGYMMMMMMMISEVKLSRYCHADGKGRGI